MPVPGIRSAYPFCTDLKTAPVCNVASRIRFPPHVATADKKEEADTESLSSPITYMAPNSQPL